MMELAGVSLSLIFYCMAIIIIFEHIYFDKSEITLDIVLGALCIYLLIGAAYANAYQILEVFYPGSFVYNNAVATGNISRFDIFYFSFTTLTTVGFGDIIVATPQAKSIVILEQMTGVLYLAVIVARLVSSLRKS